MTLLAPLFFQLALLAAGIAIALHFIVTRQPPSSVLPTARFVPRDTVQVTTLSRPRDLLLLLLRVLTVLLIGLAFARPVLVGERQPVARIIMADVSSAVNDIGEVRDSVRALLRPQDVLIAFDTAARVASVAVFDTLSPARIPARLSPALVRALRTAARLRERADSIEMVLVSPLRASAVDGATLAIRDLWPGPMRMVDVAARTDSLTAPGVQIRAAADDGVRLAFAQLSGEPSVRLVRGALSSEDTAWAARGHTLVHWPVADAPAGFGPRNSSDTAGAVVIGETALVFPLIRAWAPTDSTATVVARWIDGEPAALERTIGTGCVRSVAVPVPQRGDFVLRPAFAHFAHALTSPCAAHVSGPPLDANTRAALTREGPLVHRDAITPPDDVATPLVPWLIAAALLLALLELLVRRARPLVRAQEPVVQQETAA